MKVKIKKKANFGTKIDNPIFDLQVEDNQIQPVSDSFSILGGETHENGGTNIAYQGNIVEAQKGEPVSKNMQGDVVAWGKMKNPLTGRMFESDAKLLAKEENKNSKIRDKATELSMKDPANDRESFSFTTAGVLQDAFEQRNNDFLSKREEYSTMQQNILDFSDALGMKPKKLAERLAKNGTTLTQQNMRVRIKKAVAGDTLKWNLKEETPEEALQNAFTKKQIDDYNLIRDEEMRMRNAQWVDNSGLSRNKITPTGVLVNTEANTTSNSVNRPSLADQNKLNPFAFLPEVAALLDRPDYVAGQYFTPTLYSPYRVSFQDQVNENNAAFNQISRSLRGNPEALATLAADVYQRNNTVQAQEFRTNQEIANQVNNQNVSLLNQAQLQNNQYADQQYTRQEMARANTQANRQAALQSISNKILQNKAENNYIRQMESMSNFRGDKQGNITNMNDAAKFYFPDREYSSLTNDEKKFVMDRYLTDLKNKTSEQQKAKFGRLIK